MKMDILGIKIDDVNMDQALERIEQWMRNPGKHYVVTPNLEFILAANQDLDFKQVLNNADMAIPDSSSLGFSHWLLRKPVWQRLLFWPILLTPFKQVIPFERVSGIDLMESLCKMAAEKGFTTGFLGGKCEVAKKCSECLLKKYPDLKVLFASSGGKVDREGQMEDGGYKMVDRGKKDAESKIQNPKSYVLDPKSLPPSDILFVAFGHIKQEKWMVKNLDKISVRVAMGVGGAFDYLSGSVPRAPQIIRSLGLEWLFRLIIQPWRIKRQLGLIKYLWLLLTT